MGQICTTIEQSRKLLEAGLDIETADMYIRSLPIQEEGWKEFPFVRTPYDKVPGVPECPSLTDGKAEKWPAWSISALLHRLPFPELWQEMFARMIVWKCKVTYYEDDVSYTSQICNTEMDAVLDCVIWVLENKHKNYC